MSRKSRSSNFRACDKIRACRDKMEMAKVRSTPWGACLSKNHSGVLNSKRFYIN